MGVCSLVNECVSVFCIGTVVARLVWTNRHYPFEPVLWESPPPLVHLYNPKDLANPDVQAAKETPGSIPINYALAGTVCFIACRQTLYSTLLGTFQIHS